MEGLNLQLLLLEESFNLSNFAFKRTIDGEELTDWMTASTAAATDVPKKSMGHLTEQAVKQNKKNNLKRDEVSGPGNISKGLRLPTNRRSTSASCILRSKSRYNALGDVKFEHFRDASDYIEQYRKTKLVRLHEAFDNFSGQHEPALKTVESCHSALNMIQNINHEKDVPCIESQTQTGHQRPTPCVTPTASSSSETGQLDLLPKGQSDVLTKPSLPRTGFFTGKKWVYSKNASPTVPCTHSGGKRHTGSRFKGKKHESQARVAEDMCLKGTGKPLNISLNKTWTVPLFRRKISCKSAPSSPQRSLKKDLSTRLSSHTIDSIPVDVLSKSQHFVDFSCLANGTNYTPSKPAKGSSLRRVESRIPEQGVHNQQCLDYENIFKDVIDFYGHNKPDRSHVYVRIGS